jgi:hypothetical protein
MSGHPSSASKPNKPEGNKANSNAAKAPNAHDQNPAMASTLPSLGLLEEDDEFEDFPVEGILKSI